LVSLLLQLVGFDPEITKKILAGVGRYPVENWGNTHETNWEGKQGK